MTPARSLYAARVLGLRLCSSAIALALFACGDASPRAPTTPREPRALVTSGPTADRAAEAPAASADTPAGPGAPVTSYPGVEGVPGALARFGSLSWRVRDVLTRVYAFDDGRIWAAEHGRIRDIRTDDTVMTVTRCAAYDILPSGDQLACLQRGPTQVEFRKIPSGDVVSKLALGVKPPPQKSRSPFSDHPASIDVTEAGGLLVVAEGSRLRVSALPYKVQSVEKAPDPLGFARERDEPLEDPPRRRMLSPNGKVRATLDRDTLRVAAAVNGKIEGFDGWSPRDSPIGGAWLSDGGFVLWYGRSWERLSPRGVRVAEGDHTAARHYMLGAFVHEGRDGAFVGAELNDDGYQYRLMTPDLAKTPLFTIDRCLAQVPGTTSIVCSDIRIQPGKSAAEGDIVLIDATSGAERGRRALSKDHLMSAHVAADGGVYVERMRGKDILDKSLGVAVPDFDKVIEASGKRGRVVGLLPKHAALFRSADDGALWVVESGAFRQLFAPADRAASTVAVSPDGRRIAVVVFGKHDETELLVIDARTGAAQAKFVAPLGDYVGTVAFDASGQRILTAAQGIVWLWDATSRGVL